VTGATFRFAAVDDAAAVASLVERAYRGEESKLGWTTEADLLEGPRTSPETIAGLIAGSDARFVLAEEGGALVACAMIQRQGDRAYFGTFAVEPRRQARGLGKAVLAASERAAAETWGARLMVMTVINERTSLIEWYERRGYDLTGERRAFPFSAQAGAVRQDFDFVVMEKAL
jgi:ribosomal protein S18 acetylase RimI-like enzyme